MSETDPPATDDERTAINEDWAATVVGLVLLALVLIGVIPVGLVP
ncbi:hypothetical protein [Streptosporangium lutulentum]|uniref:Uncharacterized protein n=1 Tax=Streptosporangium lutulentum TaxID=1461250 RepID=A0ABT9QGR7_9ACTN|nr:hypothetical protein [Streptosporangium lutulentum]MDP9845953.1 hypothetical protein [Streptosporangium lutulentum]